MRRACGAAGPAKAKLASTKPRFAAKINANGSGYAYKLSLTLGILR
jgi:hypothetical protein